jgi:hypothetical protein
MPQNPDGARSLVDENRHQDIPDTPERIAAKEGVKTHVSSLLPIGYEVEVTGDRPQATLIELFARVSKDDWRVEFVELPEGWEGMEPGELHASVGERVVTTVERIENEWRARTEGAPA